MPLPVLPVIPFDGDAEAFMKRYRPRESRDHTAAKETAERIVADVQVNGDRALFAYTAQYDKATLTAETVKVSESEIQDAYAAIDPAFTAVIGRAIERIRRYHDKQLRNSWLEPMGDGELLGQMIRPIDTCGIYVPGGTAALSSSLLMLAIPAMAAGVRRIVVATPCDANGRVSPSILVAAAEAGLSEIYKVGGAQAIAAMAFGTESIPKVDKIVGPGNIYVTLAKRAVYGYVGIDSIAGPSEIVIVADKTADAVYVAADMLSQAEHDVLASSVLITDCQALAEAVQQELIRQAETLERRDIIAASLAKNGLIVLTNDLDDAIKLSDALAPEHLALCTEMPFSLLSRIHHAGAVFLGHFTPEPLGDYMAGPSHVLPTDTTARFFSPVSVDDFIKKTSLLSFDQAAMNRLKPDVIRFAIEEKLTAHANALRVRG